MKRIITPLCYLVEVVPMTKEGTYEKGMKNEEDTNLKRELKK